MPLHKCSSGGKSGWKFGKSGKCYTGPGAKKKALKQGVAIHGPKKFAKIMGSDDNIRDELLSIVDDIGSSHEEISNACVALGYNTVQRMLILNKKSGKNDE